MPLRLDTLACVWLLAGSALAQQTERASVARGGAQASGRSLSPAISSDGRCVAFASEAADLVPGDTNGCRDVFLRDRIAGTTERVSVGSGGTQASGQSDFPALSADGRFVAFRSFAADLVAGDTNACADVFVRDRLLGTTVRVSVASSGLQADGASEQPSLSADGRRVAFASDADDLVAGDTNLREDVFLRDMLAGTTLRVSVSSSGLQGNSGSAECVISADGRYVSFDSDASNLGPGDTNACEDVYRRDLLAGITERVSIATGGAQGNAPTGQSSISADGRFVTMFSSADTLVAGDTNVAGDVFVRDCVAGTLERASVATGGVQADSGSINSSISADGRFVSFLSYASNLVSGDGNGVSDIFVRDRSNGTTERVSLSSSGAEADLGSGYDMISADGRWVAFESDATTLVAGDTNGAGDVFVHDRSASGFASLCDPGAGGVGACPCSNPPAGAGRGCDNSSATGGAVLAASGVSYLSSDSLVFTTSAEKPSATSIVLQGSALVPNGVVFGQGVRCAGGALKRLYTKTAVNGSISAPGAGDPAVSLRSAQLGDALQPGSTRWYLVYYRDPIVLGSCPVTSTFNATQTGSIAWQP
jgi:Tol biopolymer transport system component